MAANPVRLYGLTKSMAPKAMNTYMYTYISLGDTYGPKTYDF